LRHVFFGDIERRKNSAPVAGAPKQFLGLADFKRRYAMHGDCEQSFYLGHRATGWAFKLAALEAADLAFDAANMNGELVATRGAAPPLLLMEFNTLEGKRVRLHDYATAGEGEVPYVSWLTVTNVAPTPFSNTNPLRSGRPLGER
jgi:hypothetical protein